MKCVELNVLIVRRNDAWVAQCLQYDIAAQAKTIPEVKYEFMRMINVQTIAALENHLDPLNGLPPAPDFYWEQYKKVSDETFEPKPLPRFMVAPEFPEISSRVMDRKVEMRVLA